MVRWGDVDDACEDRGITTERYIRLPVASQCRDCCTAVPHYRHWSGTFSTTNSIGIRVRRSITALNEGQRRECSGTVTGSSGASKLLYHPSATAECRRDSANERFDK